MYKYILYLDEDCIEFEAKDDKKACQRARHIIKRLKSKGRFSLSAFVGPDKTLSQNTRVVALLAN